MSLLHCLIIDDEPIARRILVDYCGQVPDLEIVGVMENAVDAWHFIQNGTVDLIFLDIEMPHLDGLRLMSALKPTPFVVFTTAFTEYAVTAFELAASDYLLKPFSFERFLVAINRVMNQRQSRPGTGNVRTESEFVFIKAGGKIFQLRYDDIFYAEAGGNYSTLVTKSGRLQPNIAFSNL